MNMSIIAASRLRGKTQPEANTFIGNVYNSVLTNEGNTSVQLRTESDVANFLSTTTFPVVSDDIKNLQNNGRDIKFYIDKPYRVFSPYQVIDYYLDFGSNVDVFQIPNIQIDNKLFYCPSANIGNSAYQQTTASKYRYGIGFYFGNLVGDTPGLDDVFNGNIGNAKLFLNSSLETINNGSPDEDITKALNEGNFINYVTTTQRQNKPLAPTISPTNNIGGTYLELNVTQPTHANLLKYALVFINGFFQNIYNIDNLIISNLQEQTNYNIKVIIADEYFNISSYSNLISVTTTTTSIHPAFQNSTSYYKFDEITGQGIDFVNGHTAELFGGIEKGVSGKIFNGIKSNGVEGKYVKIPKIAYDENAFYISGWFYFDSANNYGLELINRGNSNKGVSIQINQNINITYFGVAALGTEPSSAIENSLNHFIVEKTGNEIKVYVNNVLKYTRTNTYLISDNNLFFNIILNINGFPISDRSKPFILDEIDLRNTPYTVAERSSLYNNGNGTTI